VTVKDVGGIFSRYFMAGFFLPAFFGLLAASLAFAPELAPQPKERLNVVGGVTLLVAAALLAGLILVGLRRPTTRLFEGYPLHLAKERARSDRWIALPSVLQGWVASRVQREVRLKVPAAARPSSYGYLLWALLHDRQRGRRARIASVETPQGRRELDRYFGVYEGELLPTRFGNVLRAFEYHADSRWGLSGLAAWPRIAPLLSDGERALHTDAETDVMFFVNASLTSWLLGAAFLAVDIPDGDLKSSDLRGPLVLALAYVLYRFAVVAAVGWGMAVRASIDLHRLELYQRLGIRRPASFTHERMIAGRLSRLLDLGERMPDYLWEPRVEKRS
jgi:hypothetical protein